MRSLVAVLALLAACDDAPDTVSDGGVSFDAPQQPDAGAWTQGPEVAGGAIQETAAVALDGRIYVIGGFDAKQEIVDRVVVYSVESGGWSVFFPLPRPVHHANAAVVDGTIYVLGALGDGFAPIADAWAVTPGVDTGWRTLTSLPIGRGSAAVGVVDGEIVLAGGLAGFSAIDDVAVYDPVEDSWDESWPDLPEPRDHGCGATVDGRFFVIGGRGGAITSVTGSVLEWSGKGWEPRAAMPTARGGVACGVVGDRVVVVGGEGNTAAASGVFPQVEIYDPAGDDWASQPDMPRPRHGMGAAGWDGALYVPGGADAQAFAAVSTFDWYRP
jgi:N-acetylneuraminic acid mutarotase